MQNTTFFKLIALLIFSVSLISCNNNDELISKYKEIQNHIDENEYDELVKKFDKDSRAFIELISDTTQLEYDNLRSKAKKYNLEHFTINYLFEFSGYNKPTENKYNPIFFYFKLVGVPLFDLFSEQKILEKETKTGKENYVTVAKKVREKTYITKKIKFSQEDGEYKLNFLDLLNRNEEKLAAAVKKYRKKYLANLPEEILTNPNIDSTKRRDFLYTYMHFSRKDDFEPAGYYYNKSAATKRAIRK